MDFIQKCGTLSFLLLFSAFSRFSCDNATRRRFARAVRVVARCGIDVREKRSGSSAGVRRAARIDTRRLAGGREGRTNEASRGDERRRVAIGEDTDDLRTLLRDGRARAPVRRCRRPQMPKARRAPFATRNASGSCSRHATATATATSTGERKLFHMAAEEIDRYTVLLKC